MDRWGAQDLILQVEDHGDRVVVTLAGELDLVGAPELENAAAPPARAGQYVVLDLRKLEFMDSSGVRAVVAINSAAGEGGGRLSIVPGSADGPVGRLLTLSGLDRVLDLIGHPLTG
jgi:anti-sigma B factor antagonist